MKTIHEFQGEFRFLSNFWPCQIEYEGLIYPSTEHAYQAAKIDETRIKVMIRDCPLPADAKDFFDKQHVEPDPGWTIEKKLRVMEALQVIKFDGHEPLLTRALLATGETILVEGNNWNDRFWGVCNGAGENNLGKILMKVRAELFRQKEKIITLLDDKRDNKKIAETLSIPERTLYEKMIAFSIPNKDFWIG